MPNSLPDATESPWARLWIDLRGYCAMWLLGLVVRVLDMRDPQARRILEGVYHACSGEHAAASKGFRC
jgi:hypothetical protein